MAPASPRGAAKSTCCWINAEEDVFMREPLAFDWASQLATGYESMHLILPRVI